MNREIDLILKERFENDSLISVATVDEAGKPWVRTVDTIYIDGAFYTITNALTNKILTETLWLQSAVTGFQVTETAKV